MRMFVLIFLIFFSPSLVWADRISIVAPACLLDTSVTRMAIVDVQTLLGKACSCEVLLNGNSADIQILLPDIAAQNRCGPNRFEKAATVPFFSYPDHDYKWTTYSEGDVLVLKLEADCFQGVVFGLYGLLQEQLGFRFYHPKETIIPSWQAFPMQPGQTFAGRALFDKKGFHLHTQHPLELTEHLHDPDFPGALEEVKFYLDWLVRNGQTYFEFCLLRSLDKNKWPTHARAMVDYGHQRGLIMGVDLSLHMIQQKAFKLYRNPPRSFRSKKTQTINTMKWLLEGGWDVLNVEFATAEFVGGNRQKKELLRLDMLDWLQNNSAAKLMGRKHVVKDENERFAKEESEMDSLSRELDRQRGILIHTVMFYDMTEPNAPVYENENLRHMYRQLIKEKERRETWYYPESAYWITFDNSLPMFLLPYLNARLNDIDTCIKHQIPGHITFSSGWEWGYWLFDWSIARWSWEYAVNDTILPRSPSDAIELLFGKSEITDLMKRQLSFQQQYLKDSNLIQWMTAMTVTDELPFGLDVNFGPRPEWSYKEISRKISFAEVERIRKEALPLLDTFNREALLLAEKTLTEAKNGNNRIMEEWADGLLVTALRARHRQLTLTYLLQRREARIQGKKFSDVSLLEEAATVRQQAAQIVEKRERNYRYPADFLFGRRHSYTAYQYGYLFPTRGLHFWHREERQAEKDRWGPLFMNIWDIPAIIGLKK